jgi:hypothetical protein
MEVAWEISLLMYGFFFLKWLVPAMRNAPGSAKFVAKLWQAISVCPLPRLYKEPNKLTNPDDRLGIKIDPQAVRLQPAPEDGYAWSITDSKRHLLKSCLSNGTVGLYDEICKEIGHSIEAVRPTGVALGSGTINITQH